MPTFSPRKAPSIAQRMAELMGAPQVAQADPQRPFRMPAEHGPAQASSLATQLQGLLGATPDAAVVESPESYAKAEIAQPDLFTASVAAVKALGQRRKALGDVEGRARTAGAPGRFEADLTRSVHLQERDDPSRRY